MCPHTHTKKTLLSLLKWIRLWLWGCKSQNPFNLWAESEGMALQTTVFTPVPASSHMFFSFSLINPSMLGFTTFSVQSWRVFVAHCLLSLNSPLCRSICVVPVWPWQSFPCQWFWVAGSFQCAVAHLNTRQWSCDIGHQVSGSTSQCPSLSDWLTRRYAVKRKRHVNHQNN